MMRTSALKVVGRYPTDAPAAEDYEFFWRFMEAGETANLPDVLIRYVLDPGGISLSRRRTQLASRRRIQLEHNDGSPRALAGVARTLILEITPYRVVHRLKRARLRLPAA
jgi:hypothetical protein